MANLKQVKRTVDFSGLSGNPGDLDPLLYPLESAALTTLTYGEYNAKPGFRITDVASKIWLCTAIPGAAYNEDTTATSDDVTIEIETYIENGVANSGVLFYHYSDDHYGLDGAGYLLNYGNSGGEDRLVLFSRTSDAGSFTQLDYGVMAGFTPGFKRLRFRLKAQDGTHRIFVSLLVNGVWVELIDHVVASKVGTMFGVAIRNNSGRNTDVSELSCTFKSPKFIGIISGQSEVTGIAPKNFYSGDSQLYKVDGQGVFGPLEDPSAGTTANHATWTGLDGPSNAVGGSMLPLMGKLIGSKNGAVCLTSLGAKSGSNLAAHAPPVSGTRYLTSNRTGCRDLMTMLLAGDGRTDGVFLRHFWWIGTNDSVIGTSTANVIANYQAIINRTNSLFPGTRIHVARIGDRTYAPSGVTTQENLDVQRGINYIVNNELNVSEWFNDEDFLGPVGTNAGFEDSPDGGLHPGNGDYIKIAQHSVGKIIIELGLAGNFA